MESMWSLFKIAPQCCDAFTYVYDGQHCALTGVCSGTLRPAGTYYWFSIPVKFGLPLNVLILLNVLLMVMSIGLSVTALKKILPLKNDNIMVAWGSMATLVLASFCIHLVFLYPTLFHTLTDAPSSCLFLGGCWLLLLSEYCNKARNSAIVLGLAGLCWGLSAWLRAFYLYPVLCGLLIYILFWMFKQKKAFGSLLILLALIPIGSQYLDSYSRDGKFSYLGDRAAFFVAMHSTLNVAGYDTTLPSDGYFWQPTCPASQGIVAGLKLHEFPQVVCLVRERLRFYLGSYENKTYKFLQDTNKLAPGYVEHKGEPVGWWRDSVELYPDVARAPDKTFSADQIISLLPAANGSVYKSIPLKDNTSYTLSAWLWSPLPIKIELTLIRNYDNKPIATKELTLLPTPRRYFITGATTETPGILPANAQMEAMQYTVRIRFLSTVNPDAITLIQKNYFYLWGTQLEASPHMTEYRTYEAPKPDDIRTWKPWLLISNIIIIFLALVFIIAYRKTWLQKSSGLATLIGLLVSAAACVAIVPEQRFAITLLISIWLMATTLIIGCINNLFSKRHSR